MSEKLKVLFLCTGNSCRSQMAEGWAQHLHGERIEAYSAGTAPQGVNPRAAQVMAEAGVPLASQSSKHVDTLKDVPLDYVVTVCSNADERCPVFPGHTKVVHVGFDDPPHLSADIEDEEARLDIYRRVRDEIREFVAGLPGSLEAS